MTKNSQTIVLGAGCFWCIEAALKMIPGVLDVKPGYAGGKKENPTYEQVSTGETGHAEVVRVKFDPDQISLADLLAIYFEAHDPTTPDRQGNDIGTQYRSIILYSDPEQLETIRKAVAKAQAKLAKQVVTQVVKLVKFWPAEDYHVDYYAKNKNQPYCRMVIAPKLEKLENRN